MASILRNKEIFSNESSREFDSLYQRILHNADLVVGIVVHQKRCAIVQAAQVRTVLAMIEHLDAEAALVWLFTGERQINRARLFINRLALDLQFSETLFSFHSLIIMRVENPATVKSTLFSDRLRNLVAGGYYTTDLATRLIESLSFQSSE